MTMDEQRVLIVEVLGRVRLARGSIVRRNALQQPALVIRQSSIDSASRPAIGGVE